MATHHANPGKVADLQLWADDLPNEHTHDQLLHLMPSELHSLKAVKESEILLTIIFKKLNKMVSDPIY